MKQNILLSILTLFILTSCTKLEENLHGQITDTKKDAVDVNALLEGAYIALRTPYQGIGGWWSLQQTTTDETIPPTRGGDWDDNGAWRSLFLHVWQVDHFRIHDVFRDLNGVNYAGTDILRHNPNPEQAAQARFLRAFAQFSILDGWGQVPYREPGEEVSILPRVRGAQEEVDFLIKELNEILPTLPNNNPQLANQDAARMLLMKVYLNKGAFLNRISPSFDNADMTQVVALADQIINKNKYDLSNNYFDNFNLTNHLSKENIFLSANRGGSNSGELYAILRVTTHYNQNPSGWNGFAATSDFYDKFEENDQRRSTSYPGINTGLKMGFLIGPQFNGQGQPIQDRRGLPLSFTRDIKLIEKDNDLEVKGIRVIKYVPDYANLGSGNAENDWVFYRYSDVLLMKAEALLRLNRNQEALALINQVRVKRNATPLTTLTIDTMLDELGREFFWEAHRRTDLIRFGKFLAARQEKPESMERALLFPIPQNQLGNTNYTQNPGY